METEISPLQRAFNSFLLTMPTKELEELLKYLQDARAQEDSDNYHPGEDIQAHTEARPDSRRITAVPTRASGRSSASRGRHIQDVKKRPLNSFIAFRSYYSIIFPELTQKSKSGILRFLWQNDPFKAKWAILAKAYSIIRDDHDSDVSLDTFLALNAGFIGILEPTRYLEVMGWELQVDEQQQYTMAKVNASSANEADISTNYSVNDVVKNCYAAGYVSEGDRKTKSTQGGNASVMAFAAQPTLAIHESNSVQRSGNRAILKPGTTPVTGMTPTSKPGSTPSPNLGDMSMVVRDASVETNEVPAVRNFPLLQHDANATAGFEPLDFNFNGFGFANWGEEHTPLFPYDPSLQTPVMHNDPLMPSPYDVVDIERYLEI
ncbi:hypothetical protein HFD88_005469 [Aspergillus terreus]|nr:hypothetical protein HFD88_005469 [Aspergillus terreus]